MALSPLSVYVYEVTQPIASVVEASRPAGAYAFEVSTTSAGGDGAFGSPVKPTTVEVSRLPSAS